MLKKIVLLIFPLMLMSCQENSKDALQDLINKKDIVNAKSLAEEMLQQYPLDPYYNGAISYILSVECVSTNCSKNSPEKLKKIKQHLSKSNGLAKVDDAYFVDFYALTLSNLVTVAIDQKDMDLAVLTLRDFVNPTNKRLGFIYNEIFKHALEELLEEDLEGSSLAFSLLKDLSFNLSQDKKLAIDLLLSFETKKSIALMRNKIKSFNRVFIGRKLPEDFLIALAPSVVEYSLGKDLNPLTVLEKTIEERGSIFNENASILRQPVNVKHYAKGIELVTESKSIIERLSLSYDKDELYFKIKLQNISLNLESNNKDLWIKYVENLIKFNKIEDLYTNINIDTLKPEIIISNNNGLLEHANKTLTTSSIIDILNEVVFREDSNKGSYTNKVTALVEKALKVEISKNNLEGIFEYLNYIPSMKSKFKDELNQKLTQYISEAWEINSFKDLDRLVALYNDLNDDKKGNLLLDLYEDHLRKVESESFFVANDINTFIRFGSENQKINDDMVSKYKYIVSKASKIDIQTRVFSIVRKMPGDYTQSKVFSFFSDIFDESKKDDLIIDAVTVALAKDDNLNLVDLISLSDYLLGKCGRLPENYIKDQIVSKYKTSEDVILSWSEASKLTKNALSKYNKDIEFLIKAKENDSANKKITASRYISKINSKEISPFVEKYKKIYDSYTSKIKGFYIKEKGSKGPEIIRIKETDTLLKANINFISRLGKIENLDKYKLDRGEIISKSFSEYYNPIKGTISLDMDYNSKESNIFIKAKKIDISGGVLSLAGITYKKVNSLFEYNKSYGIVEQLTSKTRDNFHILPEGSSLSVTEEISEDLYKVKVKHPAMEKPIEVNAKYDISTASFTFSYDYFIKLLDKNFSAKAKCQLVDYKAYCAVQDKYWKREKYSVILKGLEVKG